MKEKATPKIYFPNPRKTKWLRIFFLWWCEKQKMLAWVLTCGSRSHSWWELYIECGRRDGWRLSAEGCRDGHGDGRFHRLLSPAAPALSFNVLIRCRWISLHERNSLVTPWLLFDTYNNTIFEADSLAFWFTTDRIWVENDEIIELICTSYYPVNGPYFTAAITSKFPHKVPN